MERLRAVERRDLQLSAEVVARRGRLVLQLQAADWSDRSAGAPWARRSWKASSAESRSRCGVAPASQQLAERSVGIGTPLFGRLPANEDASCWMGILSTYCVDRSRKTRRCCVSAGEPTYNLVCGRHSSMWLGRSGHASCIKLGRSQRFHPGERPTSGAMRKLPGRR